MKRALQYSQSHIAPGTLMQGCRQASGDLPAGRARKLGASTRAEGVGSTSTPAPNDTGRFR